MGASKSDSFSIEQNEMATLFKALSHPARIAIVDYLLTVDTCICGDIVNELPLAQPTISQHLKELKNANIIKGTIEGKTSCYCINWEIFNQFIARFGVFADLAKKIWKEKGISVEDVTFYWDSIATVDGREEMILCKVVTQQASLHNKSVAED